MYPAESTLRIWSLKTECDSIIGTHHSVPLLIVPISLVFAFPWCTAHWTLWDITGGYLHSNPRTTRAGTEMRLLRHVTILQKDSFSLQEIQWSGKHLRIPFAFCISAGLTHEKIRLPTFVPLHLSLSKEKFSRKKALVSVWLDRKIPFPSWWESLTWEVGALPGDGADSRK